MRHGYFGRNLSRSTDEKKRLLRSLVRDLVLRGSIRTTLAKAKAVQPTIDKLITRAKKGDDQMRTMLMDIPYPEVVKKLLHDAKGRFATRTSGYTKILRTGLRRGDATSEVLIMFSDPEVEVIIPESKSIKTEKKSEKVVKESKKSATKTVRTPKTAKRK